MTRVKVAPWPGPALVHDRRPCMSAAVSALMCSPKPCPCFLVVKPWEKIRTRCSGGMPTPLSMTSMKSWLTASSRETRMRSHRSSVSRSSSESRALLSRLTRICSRL